MALSAAAGAGAVADGAPGSFAAFMRRYRALFPAEPAAAARTRREFGWRPLTVVGELGAPSVQRPDRGSELGAALDSVDPPPPPPAGDDSDSDDEVAYRVARPHEHDDLPAAAATDSDEAEADTDLEEEVLRAPAVPPDQKKPVASQRVDEAWVKAGLLELVGRGKLRAQLRRDVRDKVTDEEITGALRPVFATNFTARFTTDTCETLHTFREGVQERLDRACWYCQDAEPVGRTQPARHGKCMQICQVTRLDVACKRRSDERFLRVVGLADPVEGRRFRRACNDTCMEEWELLLQYGAAARLRAQLGSPSAAVGRSHPILPSVSVHQVTRCAAKFELRYRLCYPAGSWAQRAVIDLEHTALGFIVAGALGAVCLLLCLAACCYYKVLQIPRIAAKVNGWLRRRRPRWRLAGGVERTESGHYRRPSLVATGAHGKQSRDHIKQTVQRWRQQRAAEGRKDGAPRSLFSAVQLLHPPTVRGGTGAAADDTSAFSEQIETDNSG